MQKIIWLGAIIGSTVGGYVPCLWGASMISMSGVVGGIVGGFAGVFAGYKLAQMIGL